jgi:hypothetical protein
MFSDTGCQALERCEVYVLFLTNLKRLKIITFTADLLLNKLSGFIVEQT